jgi:hypothetical protein
MENFSLNEGLARYHLDLLEKALVVERKEPFYLLTSTGNLYLNNVENKQ